MAKLRHAALAVALSSALVMISGCSTIARDVVEGAMGVRVSPSGKVVSVQGKDGSGVVAGTGAQLPDGFPGDVPIYRPTSIAHSVAIASDAGDTFTAELRTPDSIGTVAAWYRTALAAEGWTSRAGAYSSDAGTVLTAEKADRSLAVTVMPSGDGGAGTTISIATGPE